jgi:iron complex transport system ATP-binding protein
MQVLSLVREFTAAGRTALVVSHDLSLAARSCDRIALLEGGGVLAVGAPGSVLTPGNLQRAFGIDADILTGPDGAPIVVPRF